MNQYKRGDIVYFLRGKREVVTAQVTDCRGTWYTLRFQGNERGSYSGIRLSENRLFPTKEAAGGGIRKRREVAVYGRALDTHWDPEYR